MGIAFKKSSYNNIDLSALDAEAEQEKAALMKDAAIKKHINFIQGIIRKFISSNELFPNQPKTEWDNWNKKQIDHRHNDAICKNPEEETHNNITFRLDGGTIFAKVPQETEKDPKEKIRTRLLNKIKTTKPFSRDLSYLEAKTYQLISLNMPSTEMQEELEEGHELWVPLPANPKKRQLSDKQFLNYCHQAVSEMLTQDNDRDLGYKKELQSILKHIDEKELLSMMMAIAKQESGNPIGLFSFHNWEANKKAFSCSMFHILIRTHKEKDTAGLTALKKLKMTQGQIMHPKNAAKAFIGFLCETYRSAHPGCSNESIAQYIAGFSTSAEGIADIHNGTGWRNTNPDYADKIKQSLKEAKSLF